MIRKILQYTISVLLAAHAAIAQTSDIEKVPVIVITDLYHPYTYGTMAGSLSGRLPVKPISVSMKEPTPGVMWKHCSRWCRGFICRSEYV